MSTNTTNVFDQFLEAENKLALGKPKAPAGGGKQASQFYQTAYVQNPKSKWVDNQTVDEGQTSLEMTTQVDGVEPSVMFDELAQTQISLPAGANKADKNKLKLQQMTDALAKKTAVTSFGEAAKKKKR